jgi:hypothetical protein
LGPVFPILLGHEQHSQMVAHQMSAFHPLRTLGLATVDAWRTGGERSLWRGVGQAPQVQTSSDDRERTGAGSRAGCRLGTL